MGTMRGPQRPIKKYKCDDCGQVFEKPYDPQKEPVVHCLYCGDPNVHRIFPSPTGKSIDGVEPEIVRAG